jgi:hypothetical protein
MANMTPGTSSLCDRSALEEPRAPAMARGALPASKAAGQVALCKTIAYCDVPVNRTMHISAGLLSYGTRVATAFRHALRLAGPLHMDQRQDAQTKVGEFIWTHAAPASQEEMKSAFAKVVALRETV